MTRVVLGSASSGRLRILRSAGIDPLVVVSGVDADQAQRRQIRAEANDLLGRLGYAVEIAPGRDVFDLEPVRPASSHEQLQMLRNLHSACNSGG